MEPSRLHPRIEQLKQREMPLRMAMPRSAHVAWSAETKLPPLKKSNGLHHRGMETSALEARIENLEDIVAQILARMGADATPANLTRVEAAKYGRVGLSLLDEAIRLGKLNAAKKGRRVIIKRSDVDAWLDGGAH